ncbi:hypothetical protein E8E13_008658 [Curvularia kusanoi]|uniref:Uncharacterized protein n=1 Tax=Curvularia kusanoi TaxID=90978 RepID=A0A9P4TFX7_CURKU|nr:hypothetical protein E8E13_008658 [Curvularia kusanoi]
MEIDDDFANIIDEDLWNANTPLTDFEELGSSTRHTLGFTAPAAEKPRTQRRVAKKPTGVEKTPAKSRIVERLGLLVLPASVLRVPRAAPELTWQPDLPDKEDEENEDYPLSFEFPDRYDEVRSGTA